jgi:hypothetical protein
VQLCTWFKVPEPDDIDTPDAAEEYLATASADIFDDITIEANISPPESGAAEPLLVEAPVADTEYLSDIIELPEDVEAPDADTTYNIPADAEPDDVDSPTAVDVSMKT